jgi:hypothetical protein
VFLTNQGVRVTGGGFDFVGANRSAEWRAEAANGNTTSYYIGRTPRPELVDTPHYGKLQRHQVYPGVDIAWYGRDGKLEYDFLLAPHADPAQIRIRFTGEGRLDSAKDGSLEWRMGDTRLTLRRPAVYQQFADGSKRSVDGKWRRAGRDLATVSVGAYDAGSPLVIDPVLEYSTYVGGGGEDSVFLATPEGVVVGTTTSLDLATDSSAPRGGSDVFVTTRWGGRRNTIIIGGSGDEVVTSVAMSASSWPGILIGGYTTSTDLPVVAPRPALRWTPWQKEYAGGATDGFLLFVGAAYQLGGGVGLTEAFLTYVGTPGDDRVTGAHLALSFGSSGGGGTSLLVAICGSTSGRGLPRTAPSALEEPEGWGGLDIFYMTGSALTGSTSQDGLTLASTTYLGGSGDDVPYAITAGPSGPSSGYYIAGETSSPDFAVGGEEQAALKGSSDAFVVRVGAPAAAVRFGGGGWDRAYAIAALDNQIAVAGASSSADFEQLNPAQATYGGGASDAFVARFDLDLKQAASATLLGGSGEDAATAIASDFLGGVYVAGWTGSDDFPTREAVQARYGGGASDGFVAHLNEAGVIRQSTWYGGSGDDRFTSVSASGSTAWTTGRTSSPDLPMQDAERGTLAGASDGFIARLDSRTIQAPSALVCPKDTSTSFSIQVGSGRALPFSVTSGDPAKVLVLVSGSGPGQASFTSSTPPNGVRVECLVDNGGADVTVSSPGYADAVVRVACVRGVIAATATPSSPTAIRPYTSLRFQIAPADRSASRLTPQGYELRSEASPITIRTSSSNPELGPPPEECAIAPDMASECGYYFTPAQYGATTLSFTAAGWEVSPSSIPVVAAAPQARFRVSSVALPVGFQGLVSFSGGAGPVTFASSNPSGIVVSSDPQKVGTASLTYSPTSSSFFYVQAIAQGEYALRLSSQGQEDAILPVTVTTPVARLRPASPFATPLVLRVGETTRLSVTVGPESISQLVTASLNPGSSVRLGVRSSDAATLRVSPEAAELAPAASSLSFEITALQEGTAELSVVLPDGFAPAPAQQRMPVKVLPRAAQ